MRYKLGAFIATIGLVVFSATGCGTSSSPKSQAQESTRIQSNYDQLVAAQPSHTMDYSPTRNSINFWVDTWKQPNKLSYVYMLASNGQLIGYYVFQGLPVSYCASLTPTYQDHQVTTNDAPDVGVTVPAPSVDGVYYSGGQCNEYFGKDASTGAYIEYFAGQGISPLIYSEPLARQGVEPLGFTTIDQAKAIDAKK